MSDVIFVSHDVLIDTDLIATEMLNSFGFFIHNLSLHDHLCILNLREDPQERKKNILILKKTLFLSMSLSFSKWWKCSESVVKSLGKVKTNV